MLSTDTSRSLLDRLRTSCEIRDWELFCEIYEPFIRRHLLLREVAQTDVDDQIQEILLRLTKSVSSFQHNGQLGAFRKWLGMIITQQVWRYFQQRNHEAAISASFDFTEAIDYCDERTQLWDAEYDQFIVQRMLELIRREFTETTWRAFQMLTLGDLTPHDVARKLGISPNAAVIAKSRVLRRLRVVGRDLIDRF